MSEDKKSEDTQLTRWGYLEMESYQLDFFVSLLI